jgi:hypothetical protein
VRLLSRNREKGGRAKAKSAIIRQRNELHEERGAKRTASCSKEKQKFAAKPASKGMRGRPVKAIKDAMA